MDEKNTNQNPKIRNTVEALVDKALNASDAAQAAGFSQAACNVANALRVLTEIDRFSVRT